MKLSSILLFSLLFPTIIFAQNLVLNPSFENINACPSYNGGVHKTNFWTSPVDTLQASPDLFHVCGTSSLVTTPNNFSGSQFPHTGDAYVGIITTSMYPQGNLPNYREYIQGELAAPLIAGNDYKISFWVSPSDFCKYGTPKLGIHLRNNQIGPFQTQPTNSSILPITPQLTNDSLSLDNTSIWTKLEWNYNAIGGEQYFIIGHFENDTIMDLTVVNPNATGGFAYQGYYYIDDISIEENGLNSITTTASLLNMFKVSPNPANNLINIEIELAKVNGLKYNLLNSIGQFVSSSHFGEIKSKKFTLNSTNLANGVYFIQMIFEGSTITKKIIIQH